MKRLGSFTVYAGRFELFWKFLKMHIKLDRLIMKISRELRFRFMLDLITYLLLQLATTPKEFGDKLLDKLRYLQAFMCENIWLCSLVEEVGFLLTRQIYYRCIL
jgi:hypothetical protein